MPMTVVRLLLGSYVYCDATRPRLTTSWFKLPEAILQGKRVGMQALSEDARHSPIGLHT